MGSQQKNRRLEHQQVHTDRAQRVYTEFIRWSAVTFPLRDFLNPEKINASFKRKYEMDQIISDGLDSTTLPFFIDLIIENKISAIHAANAIKRHQGTHADKQFIHSCWLEWKAHPTKYKNKSAFARDMLDKVDQVTNFEVIMRYCRQWQSEKKIAEFGHSAAE